MIAAGLLLLGSTAARADDVVSTSATPEPPVDQPAPQTRPADSRFEMWIGGMMFPASLRDVRFSGMGTQLGGGRMSVSHTGRELGVQAPTFYGGELGLAYRHTYFGVGLTGFFAQGYGGDAKATNAYVAGLASPGSPIAYGAAIEILGAIPIGPITASLGGVAGVRAFQIPLNGFAPARCTERNRSFACSEDATTGAVPFFHPRLRVDVTLDDARSFFIGGYVGLDALGDRSMTAGLMLGVRTANLSF